MNKLYSELKNENLYIIWKLGKTMMKLEKKTSHINSPFYSIWKLGLSTVYENWAKMCELCFMFELLSILSIPEEMRDFFMLKRVDVGEKWKKKY
jgi:hypothetical protein